MLFFALEISISTHCWILRIVTYRFHLNPVQTTIYIMRFLNIFLHIGFFENSKPHWPMCKYAPPPVTIDALLRYEHFNYHRRPAVLLATTIAKLFNIMPCDQKPQLFVSVVLSDKQWNENIYLKTDIIADCGRKYGWTKSLVCDKIWLPSLFSAVAIMIFSITILYSLYYR